MNRSSMKSSGKEVSPSSQSSVQSSPSSSAPPSPIRDQTIPSADTMARTRWRDSSPSSRKRGRGWTRGALAGVICFVVYVVWDRERAIGRHVEEALRVRELHQRSVLHNETAGQQAEAASDAAATAAGDFETGPLEPHTGKKRVLVTGGAGFIGSHVAEYLLDRGDDVIVVDELNEYYDVSIKLGNLKLLRQKALKLDPKFDSQSHKNNNNGTQRLVIYQCDVADQACMHNVFQRERIQWVCHLAARAGVRPSIQDPFIYIHSNIEGTTRLLDLSRQFHVHNFVYASSSSVYGGSNSTFFSEAENVDRPISPYAASKKSSELLAYTYHHLYGIPCSGLRFFTVYGPRGRPDMAPYKFIDRISHGLPISKFGDGSTSRDYTYISDIVDGVVRSIDRPYPYQIFNLGKGSGTSLNDFIAIVEKYTNKKAKINQMPMQPGDVPYTCADVKKASHLLGYNSKVTFDEGIRRTVQWHQSLVDQLPKPKI